MVNLMLSDLRAVALYWGPQRIMLCNEAYIAATGQKHPGMMGKPFTEAWEEIAVAFKRQFEKAYFPYPGVVTGDGSPIETAHGAATRGEKELHLSELKITPGVQWTMD
jgi:PAS domain-containing protein